MVSLLNRISFRASLVALLLTGSLIAPGFIEAQSPQTAQPIEQAQTLDSVRARITAIISQPQFSPAAWGIKVVSLDTGKIVFEHNAGKYFNPASNAKLYTAALALDRLGGDYRIKTSLYATARPDARGTLKGDLIVYGRGDPGWAARLNDGDYYKGLEPLVEQLENAGVRRIEGDLIADESYFQGPPLGSGWEWDDLQWYYGAEVSALVINDNSLDLFVKPAERAGMPCRISTGPPTSYVTFINKTKTIAKGGQPRLSVYRPVGENIIYVSGELPIGGSGYTGYVAVHNPAGLFASLFKEALARRGIMVTGRTRVFDWHYREVTPLDFKKVVDLGSVQSLPLNDMVRETLKPSQNLWAQLLLLQVGVNSQQSSEVGPGAQSDQPERTTEEAGVEAMKAFLSEVGVTKGDVVLEEGSGLSRRDMITPAATVELLRFMNGHASAQAFRDALPIAGVDGTLKNRMNGTPAEGNVRAKTGSLSYVYTLSGYCKTASGEHLAFSILLNNYYNSDRTSSVRNEIDAIAVALAGFSGSSRQ